MKTSPSKTTFSNVLVHGDTLPLGSDDVIDYLSQYGVVTVDPRGMYHFACWLTDHPLSEENTNHYSDFQNYHRRLYAFVERPGNSWTLVVIICPRGVIHRGMSLNEAVAAYLELPHPVR